ncbi:immunity 52 family protein [Achromobacter sp.]|uniref:immunity 52 family protein n=1 Tax=Achromobacter sp. TaxID=134375 RepID=UPI003C784EF9
MLITAQFRDPSLRPEDFSSQLEKLLPLTLSMDSHSRQHKGWYAQGDSLEEALLYPAFDKSAPSAALLAMLKHKYRKDASVTHIALWNGETERDQGISISIQVGSAFFPSSLDIDTMDDAAVGSLDEMATIIGVIIDVLRPLYVVAHPRAYSAQKVFDDKPGVGWMLYLPQVITAEQVPEAQALIPVPVAGKKQTGTIIVSVANEVFSLDNASHVELANRIEMRLVDQDLLPRYADL